MLRYLTMAWVVIPISTNRRFVFSILIENNNNKVEDCHCYYKASYKSCLAPTLISIPDNKLFIVSKSKLLSQSLQITRDTMIRSFWRTETMCNVHLQAFSVCSHRQILKFRIPIIHSEFRFTESFQWIQTSYYHFIYS